ncbi:hypothetical protein ACFORL_10940, partial [Legionella dresdenensis]
FWLKEPNQWLIIKQLKAAPLGRLAQHFPFIHHLLLGQTTQPTHEKRFRYVVYQISAALLNKSRYGKACGKMG